jgi:hypothetical protein
MTWKYTDSSNSVVSRTNADGSQQSSTVAAIADWIAEGNTPDPAYSAAELAQQVIDRAAASKDASDLVATKTYNKLKALVAMSPADIQAWTSANITTLMQARDALTTLAIAVSILGRRL